MGHRRYCRLYRGTVSIAHKRAFRGGRRFELRHREISDGGDYLPGCALRIHRNHRRSLWPPFHPCSAPSGPVLGLVAAVRGGHHQLGDGWNCAQQATCGYNNCVKSYIIPAFVFRPNPLGVALMSHLRIDGWVPRIAQTADESAIAIWSILTSLPRPIS